MDSGTPKRFMPLNLPKSAIRGSEESDTWLFTTNWPASQKTNSRAFLKIVRVSRDLEDLEATRSCPHTLVLNGRNVHNPNPRTVPQYKVE